jgi:hypothetical protein
VDECEPVPLPPPLLLLLRLGGRAARANVVAPAGYQRFGGAQAAAPAAPDCLPIPWVDCASAAEGVAEMAHHVIWRIVNPRLASIRYCSAAVPHYPRLIIHSCLETTVII